LQEDRRWGWLETHQDQPLLVRFDDAPRALPGHDEALRLAWGRRGRRFTGAPYESVWMTGEEAMSLRFCLATAPTAVWLAKGWESGPTPPWTPAQPQDPLEGCSLLCGLREGAFWRAWSTPLRDDRRLRPTPSSLAVWWRSADRLRCLSAALICQQEGLEVLSYGNGQVEVAFAADRPLVDWERALVRAGLLVPRDLAPVARVPSPPQWNADTIEAWLLSSSQPLEAWFSLDRMIAPWLGSDRRQLKGLMSGTLSALAQIPPPADAPPDWSSKWRTLLLERSRFALSQLLPAST
jgi:hypothetical protein